MNKKLSLEAKVIAASFFQILPNNKLSFNRPWAIHPKARKGLTDLVETGYLIETPRNHIENCPVDFNPTTKMKTLPRVSREWLEEHGDFPMTIKDLNND